MGPSGRGEEGEAGGCAHGSDAGVHMAAIRVTGRLPAGGAGPGHAPLSLAVRHGGPGSVREPDGAEPAGRSEVYSDARGGAAGDRGAGLYGGQQPLHPRGRGRGAGQGRARPHHLLGHR